MGVAESTKDIIVAMIENASATWWKQNPMNLTDWVIESYKKVYDAVESKIEHA